MTERTVTVRLRALTSNFTGPMKQAGTQSAQFARTHDKAMATAGKAMMAFGAVGAFAMSKSATAANELNSEMANVATLIPGQTKRVYDLRDGVQDLAVTVGKSTSDISGGLYQVVSAFGDTADTAKILEINAKGARAGLAETTDAINLTSAVTKGYGDTTAEAVEHAADLAFTTVRLGQTTFPELAASIGSVVPLAAALNVTQEELFGSMATFTGVTGNAAEVSTQLTSVLTAMMNPSAELSGLMDELGYATGEAMIEGLGFQGTIQAIADEAESSGTPIMAFLRRKEAVTLALAASGGQADVFTDKLGQMSDAAGAMEEAFREQTEGISKWAFNAEQATVEQQIAMQKLGEAVAPVRATLAGFLGDVATKFSNLTPEMQQAASVAGMAASGIGLVGGAALIAVPKVIALNTALAATGGIAGTTRKALVGTARFMAGPWGIAAGGAALAIMPFAMETARARDTAEALRSELDGLPTSMDNLSDALLIAELQSRDLVGAARDLGISLDDLRAVASGDTEAFERLQMQLLAQSERFADLKTALPGLRSEYRDMGVYLEALRDGSARYNREAEAQADLTRDMGGAIDLLTSGVGGWVDRLGTVPGAAAAAGAEVDALTGEVEEATSAFDSLAPSIEAAFTTLGAGFDPMARYQELLQHINDTHRKMAESTAESTESSKDSWEDYFTETEASFEAYRESLQNTLTNQRQWHANLNKIRDAAGDEYADMLAAQGPEYADLHAAIAAEEAEAIQAGANEHLAIRDEAIQEGVDRLIRSSPEWVDAAGQVSQDTVDEIAKKLNTTEDVVRDAIDNSKPALEAAMGRLAEAAGLGSAKVVGAMIGELSLGASDIAAVTASWTSAMAKGLNPIVVAVKGEPIVVDAPAVIGPSRGTLHPMANRNTGGLIPGRGPNADTVPAMLTQGEYVVARDAVDRYGVDALEALNSGRLDPHALHLNTGGFVTPDDLPGVPRFDSSAPAMNAAGTRAVAGVLAMAKQWVEENAAPQLGPGIGYQAMMAALHTRFPGLPLYSGFRPGAITATGNPSYHGMGRAVDIPPRLDVNRWIAENYGAQTKELIFSAPGATQLRNGRPHYYTGVTRANHFDHNHWAMAGGGIIPEEVFGVGASGRTYSFGESGPERVSPLSRGSAPVTLGDVPIAEWEELKRRGWKGDPTDRAERLYPPAAANQVGGAYANFYPEGANAQTRRSINDNLFALGIMPLEDHLSNLKKRMDAEVRFSDEWMRLHNDMTRLMDDEAAKEREAAEEAQRLAEEAQRFAEQIAGNRAQWEFERMDPRGQLTDLTRRIAAEREFTDEWMDLTRQRDRLSEQVAADDQRRIEDLQRARDAELDTLNRLLDERQRILDQMADARTRHDQQAVQARERYADQARQATGRRNEQLLALEERFADERRRIVEGRSSSLFAALPIETRAAREWANTISQVLANEAERAMQRQEWAQGLDLLRGMGLSEDAISTFGLEDLTEQSLAKVRLWSGATEDEIAALNEAIAQRQSFAATRAEDEASRHLGAVGEALLELTRQTAESSSQIHAEHAQAMRDARAELNERLDELGETLTEDLTRLQAELAQIGVDQGRTYSQAIAEGIASGLPAIQAQVRRVQAAMRALNEAQAGQGAAGINPNMPIADLRAYARRIGYDDDLAHLRSRIRTRGYDSGGWLPPNSATLAINNTAKWEPVGMGTHMAAPQVNVQAPEVDVQVFVGGKQLKGDVEVWVDGRLAQRNQTSQIAGARG